MKRLLIGLVAAVTLATASAHSPLLPRPQQVQYEIGTLPLRGLSIRFAAPPTAEDRFAAEQLASRLSAIGQMPIPIRKGRGSGNAILLNRTGAGAALPGDKESAGPDSREAYSIQVTPKGAEIRAASSAGLFYGVQTLVQMVEGSGPQAALPAAAIRDWPALAYRGFMMDLSHGQLLRVSGNRAAARSAGPLQGQPVLLLFRSQHRVRGLRTGQSRRALPARRGPARHRVCAAASH